MDATLSVPSLWLVSDQSHHGSAGGSREMQEGRFNTYNHVSGIKQRKEVFYAGKPDVGQGHDLVLRELVPEETQ